MTTQRIFERVWVEGRLEEHLDVVYKGSGDGCALLGSVHGPPLTHTKLAVARAAGRVSRASGRGGGTAAPGRLLLEMAPHAISVLAGRLRDGVVLVSATNGKTTTARMLAAILEADGRAVVHNRAGANTNWGVATALAEATGEIVVLEVDEAWLPLLAGHLRPRVTVLGKNVPRTGSTATGNWNNSCRCGERWSLGRAQRRTRLWSTPTIRCSQGPAECSTPPMSRLCSSAWMTTAWAIRRPNIRTRRTAAPPAVNRSRTPGRSWDTWATTWAPACRRSRLGPVVSATAVEERGLDGTDVTIALPGGGVDVRLTQPGLHNVHNALAAASAAVALGVDQDAIRRGLHAVRVPFGRAERITVGGRAVHLCLVKNPAGA